MNTCNLKMLIVFTKFLVCIITYLLLLILLHFFHLRSFNLKNYRCKQYNRCAEYNPDCRSRKAICKFYSSLSIHISRVCGISNRFWKHFSKTPQTFCKRFIRLKINENYEMPNSKFVILIQALKFLT